ncbi:MAG: alpha/beta hydrolase, partial [Rhizobiaceae bacterium]
MANQWHVDWLKEGVIRWNRRRKKVTFAPDLSGIRFFDLLPPDFRDNPKTSHYFEKIDLSDANLASADLSSLNFARALFSHANLSFADLSKSNFQGADFTRANFQGATVQNAYLQNALFYESEIGDALLEGSDVSEAVFIGARIGDRQRGTVALAKARVFSSWEGYIEDKRRHRQLNYADSAQKLPKPDERTRKNRYDVYFGTNRLPKFERGALVDFSGNGAVNLSYGICEVIVPEGHRIGSLGSPMWKRLLNRQDNRLRIDNLIALNRELFWDAVKTVAAKMRIAERPTVFVHGYNSTFQDAVLRAAQIGYDLGLGQGIGLFSWPSKGSLFEYSADEAAAEASKYLLADFLEQFVIDSSQNGVNVISHSMGCRCLLGALEVLANGRKRV